jgi:protoporphyrinogen oxidase
MKFPVAILGAGLTGLATAAFLKRPAVLLEAQPQVGGLLRTFGRGGFWSDVGGHIIFSKDQVALDHILGWLEGQVERRRRSNVILFDGGLVKYPFENGLAELPNRQDTLECVEGFVRAWAAADRAPAARHLKDWCLRRFGPGISDKYLIPYNEKIWKTPLEDIATEWVDRVPSPELTEVLKSAIGIPTEGYTHQLYFHYPREGGIQRLAEVLRERDLAAGHQIRTGFEVRTIARGSHGWSISNGAETIEAETLVSSIPIDTLLRAIEGAPAEIVRAADQIRTNALRVVLLGTRRTDLDKHTAVYVPDPRSLYHRVCCNNCFSPGLSPAGCSSMSVEVTCREGDEVASLDDASLVARVLHDLERDGLLKPADVIETMVHRERFAYIVYDHEHAARVQRIASWAKSVGIHLAGRFAESRYLNMDGCVRRAMEVSAEVEALP